jgi:predicted membrane protein
METAMEIEKKTGLRYTVELGAAAALYVLVVLGRKYLLHEAPTGPLRTLILVSPVVPIWLMFWTILRHYNRIDEYMRLQLLQIIAFCAGISAGIYTSYPFVADAFALPPLDIGWAWPIMAVCWVAATVVVQWRTRRSLSCTIS